MASHTKYKRLTTSEENNTTSKKLLIFVKLFVLFLAILMCFGMFIEARKGKDIQNYAWKLEENPFEVKTTRFTTANSIEHSKSSIPFIPAYHMPSEIRLNPDIETMMCANGTYSALKLPNLIIFVRRFWSGIFG